MLEKNNTIRHRGTENIKMKLKAQIEILEDRDLHYTTKKLEVNLELVTETGNFAPQRQRFLPTLWERNYKKEEENFKNPKQKTT